MSDPTIDLIYVEYDDCRETSVAIINGEASQLIGPVPASGAIKALAPKVAAALPAQFGTVADAENYLVMVHFRNITMHENSAGQAYPFKVGGKKSGLE